MADHGSSYVPHPFVPAPDAWAPPPVFGLGTIPAGVQHVLDTGLQPGRQIMPLRSMTAAELAEHEREHERVKLREHIASLARSIDPAQKNVVHERAVAEQLEIYEAKLAAVGTEPDPPCTPSYRRE